MKVRTKDVHGDQNLPRNLRRAVGWYDLQLMKAGDVFELDDEKDFSQSWMEVVEESVPQNTKKIFYERTEEQKKEREESVI